MIQCFVICNFLLDNVAQDSMFLISLDTKTVRLLVCSAGGSEWLECAFEGLELLWACEDRWGGQWQSFPLYISWPVFSWQKGPFLLMWVTSMKAACIIRALLKKPSSLDWCALCVWVLQRWSGQFVIRLLARNGRVSVVGSVTAILSVFCQPSSWECCDSVSVTPR